MKINLIKRGVATYKTACFRVDAGPGVGLGHFMRCKTIAKELVDRGWVVFLIGENLPDSSQNKSMSYSKFNIIDWQKMGDSSDDIFALLNSLRMERYGQINLLVIDSYWYTQPDFAYIVRDEPFNAPNLLVTVAIDDIANRDTPAQVVINPNPLMPPEPYERQHIPTIMCGANYTIIRPEVTKLRDRVYSSKGHILITLGGGNVVELLITVLKALPENIENTICVSVSEECSLDRLSEWVDEKPDKRFINNSIEAFPELLAGASMVITAGGTTLWECYCLGIPSITVVWIDNQQNTLNIIKQKATGFLVDLISANQNRYNSNISESAKNYKTCEIIRTKKTGILVDNSDSINPDFFKNAIHQLLTDEAFSFKMRMKQRALIDGQGVKRIVDEIETLTPVKPPLFF